MGRVGLGWKRLPMIYYGMDGEPLSEQQALELFHGDPEKNRRVAQTEYGGVEVSTVLLVIDHNWGKGPPLIFETMIFGGEFHQSQWRYSTREEAEAGHVEACQKAFATVGENV